jgi:protein-S-isoprenylcysteine O-methyltransferase Ste14
MQATKFEFERRFWIIAAIFLVGFLLARFDATGVLCTLQHLLAPHATGARATTIRQIIIGIGALLVFAAAALRTWGAAYLRTEIVHDRGQHAETLVADGPFRHVRNPLYFANLPMALGIGLLASRLGCVFMVAANWLFVYRLIFREEAALRQSQGEPYRAYCAAVPRFWPSWSARLPAGNQAPRWRQAFVGESFIWLFGLAELCLALTLNLKLMAAIFIAGFVVHFFVMGRTRLAHRPNE